MSRMDYDQQVGQRAVKVLEGAVEIGAARSMWSAHATMAVGPDAALVEDIVERGLAEVEDGLIRGGPFQIASSMLLFCRWENELPQAARERIESFMTRGGLGRGNTENHWMMYYVGNLLAAERWAHLETFWNGLPPEAMRREARRWIFHTIERTARIGHHEYDSPQYLVEHVVPLLGLWEYSRDKELCLQAGRALTLMLADMAVEYFHGSWAGGHSREGYRQNTWTRVGPALALQYLYFGGEDFDPSFHI